MKKILTAVLIASMLTATAAAASYDWAKEAVDYCTENDILSGLENGDLDLGGIITNEQTAKVIVSTFHSDKIAGSGYSIAGIDPDRWSAKYIAAFQNYTKNPITGENITAPTTREEFVSSLVLANGLNEKNIRNRDILSANFVDSAEVDTKYNSLLCIAVERGYMKGSDGYLNPKGNITRAEACSLIYRVICAKNGQTLDLGVRDTYTPLVAPAQISAEKAKEWAKSKGAAQRFIDIADTYWKYGEITGIRPEILYAQAAKETKFGLYGGNVIPEQNNWAGIKVAGATGDTTYDHESFATPDDGVRAHFNHMSAYIGLAPIGEPHGRYYSAAKLAWAGQVKYLEELGGKWCPDLYYGYSILNNYLTPMLQM